MKKNKLEKMQKMRKLVKNLCNIDNSKRVKAVTFTPIENQGKIKRKGSREPYLYVPQKRQDTDLIYKRVSGSFEGNSR